MPTPEQEFLIKNNLRDVCVGVECSLRGVVVDPKPIYVSQVMRAWADTKEQTKGRNCPKCRSDKSKKDIGYSNTVA